MIETIETGSPKVGGGLRNAVSLGRDVALGGKCPSDMVLP